MALGGCVAWTNFRVYFVLSPAGAGLILLLVCNQNILEKICKIRPGGRILQFFSRPAPRSNTRIFAFKGPAGSHNFLFNRLAGRIFFVVKRPH